MNQENKSIKKINWVNWVNSSNSLLGSQDENNPIKRKSNVEDPMTRVMRLRWPLRKKIKKKPLDLTVVKMWKMVTLIMRSRYPYRN
jgi:hypothetical protein